MSAAAGARPVTRAAAEVGQDTRRTLLALLGTFLGAAPLCALFRDQGWLIDAALAMVVTVGPAALRRLHHRPSTGQIWLGIALLVPWLTLNFLRDSAVLGVLPWHGSWVQLQDLFADLHRTTTEDVAPVHTTVAIRLVLAATLALVAALVDLVAVVGRRGALAAVPLLAMYAVAGAVRRHPVSWPLFVMAAAGFLVLLALDSTDDLARWGHRLSRGYATVRVHTGRRIAIVAVAAAVVIPLLIPANARNVLADLFHESSGPQGFGAEVGTGTGGIDPFASLRGQLVRGQTVVLFKVSIDTTESEPGVFPFYLRENVLSQYTGSGWVVGSGHGPTQPLEATDFSSSLPPGSPPRADPFTAHITIESLRSNPPVFDQPTSVSGPDGDTSWSPQDDLLIGGRTTSGETIDEQVRQPDPTVRELQKAVAPVPGEQQWLQLPRIPTAVRRMTDQVITRAAAKTPYARALAIHHFFTDPGNGFVYNLQTPLGDSGDALVDFLNNRVGFCQQYAAAMAVMLRLAGVPSRVVLGYTHGPVDDSGSFTVTTNDAHAWVEAHFAGIGWIPFDPTPLAGYADGSLKSAPWAPHPLGNRRAEDLYPSKGAGPKPSATSSSRPNQPASALGRGHRTSASWVAPAVVLLLIAGLLTLGLAVPGSVRALRRRRRLTAAAAGDAEAAWDEVAETVRDVGRDWSASRTPRQAAAELSARIPSVRGSVALLAQAVERARYARPAAAEPEPIVHDGSGRTATAVRPARSGSAALGADLVTAVKEIRAALLAGVPTAQRSRALLWPASWQRRLRPKRRG